MKKIFTTLLQELNANRTAVLCGIVASHGSTPRGTGAKMLVLEDGSATGTIGGGAVELRSAELARTLLREKRSAFETYRLTAGEIADIGMICGGNVKVYFQYFSPESSTARKTLEDALTLLDNPAASWLVTAIGSNGWTMGTFDRTNGLRGLTFPQNAWNRCCAIAEPWTRGTRPCLSNRWRGPEPCTFSARDT